MSLCRAIELLPEGSWFREGGNIWLARPFLMILLKGGQNDEMLKNQGRNAFKPPLSRDIARGLLEKLLHELILVRDPNTPQIVRLSPSGAEMARELRAHNQPNAKGEEP